MKKTTRWLIAAAVLIVLGGVILVITMSRLHWDFSKLSAVKYETNTHEISEEFSNISIRTSTANVEFLTSEDGMCKIICHEAKKVKHTVSVEDGVLMIKETDSRKWYDYIDLFSFGATKITVCLPDAKYGKLTMNQSTGNITLPHRISFEGMEICTTTGDIYAKNITAGDIKCSVSTGCVVMEKLTCTGDISIDVITGDVKLTEVSCSSLASTGTTGSVQLKNVIAAGECSIERSTGDVTLEDCDALEICISTSTGSVKGKLLSDKVFIARSNTGRIDVPETTTGGKCKVTTGTGNIIFQ